MEVMTETTTKKHSRLSASIVKAMGVFGGVQLTHILCAIVRAKLVAIWIGALGVGLFGIFNSALDTLSMVTRLGIDSSAVRDIAATSSDRRRVVRMARVVMRWAALLGVFGAIIMLALSPVLSIYSFGNTGRVGAFMLLAVAVLFMALTGGIQAVLQGLRRLRRLAKAGIIGLIGGIALSIPIFYFLRAQGIALSIVVCAVVTYLAYLFNRERLETLDEPLTTGETFKLGRGFLALGFYMTISLFLTNLATYLFLSWLTHRADIDTTGFYQSGFTLFNRYVGLIFMAISVEYFPRLASVEGSRHRQSVFVDHEIRLALTVLIPVIVAFILAAPLIVRLLYTADFLVIVPFISIAIVGTLFRALSWCMAFTILARKDGRVYLLTESASAVLFLGLNIGAWELGGLKALGFAYIIWYALYALIVGLVYFRRYRLKISAATWKIMAYGCAISILAMVIAIATPWWWINFAVAITAIVIGLSYLRKRLL